MEYLDYYDENDNYLGYETREVVHSKGLWHKTVHNWLYTKYGDVIFQIRKDSEKFYTTSSGHVDKSETVEQAFTRETKEELGLDMDPSKAKLIDVVTWKMDKTKKDGSVIKDRAKASIFIVPYENDMTDFRFDTEEVLGVVFVSSQEALELFKTGQGHIPATLIKWDGEKNVITEETVEIDDFLVMPGETQLEKYGKILESIIKETA